MRVTKCSMPLKRRAGNVLFQGWYIPRVQRVALIRFCLKAAVCGKKDNMLYMVYIRQKEGIVQHKKTLFVLYGLPWQVDIKIRALYNQIREVYGEEG